MYIYDNSTLPNWPKGNFGLRSDVPAVQKVTAGDWNATAQALTDIQTALRDHGFLAANLTGSTPGSATNEAVELTPAFSCVDGSGYIVEVECFAGGVQGGSRRAKAFKRRYLLRRDSGVTTLACTGAQDDLDDSAGGTTTWTLVATIGVTPDRLVLTFNTGAGTASHCKVQASVLITAVAYP